MDRYSVTDVTDVMRVFFVFLNLMEFNPNTRQLPFEAKRKLSPPSVLEEEECLLVLVIKNEQVNSI